MSLHIKSSTKEIVLPLEHDTYLSFQIQGAGLPLDLQCSGLGVCGKCEVELGCGEYEVSGESVIVSEGDTRKALSCRTKVISDNAVVTVPESALLRAFGQIYDDFDVSSFDDLQSDKNGIGLAIDIGTTTVAALMIERQTGKILARATEYNQQMTRADDITSRISAASSLGVLTILKDLVVDATINQLILSLCSQTGVNPDEIISVVVSGNTVMSHIFLGLSPQSIGVIPFKPLMNVYPKATGLEVGLNVADEAEVIVLPSVSGYIGGDIVSDIIVTRLHEPGELTAIVDLGTNSEMVLRDGDNLYACAAAAGPAFEGAGLACGCRATDGAIEHISFDSSLDFEISIIEDCKPRGLCGSAIIDFIAYGFMSGLINSFGRFDLDMLKDAERYMNVELHGNEIHACMLYSGEESYDGNPIYVTELDLEQILKAKAAVYAGLKTMLTEEGYNFSDLKTIYLAGGFAKYIVIENAIAIGMLPELPLARFKSIGNGSLAGAYLSLLDSSIYQLMCDIIAKPNVLTLNTTATFEFNFIDSLMLPNLNEDEFPQLMAAKNS